jgi:LPS export ABC transporter permease LptG
MLKLVDRYVLREMAFPFALATIGFLVFILLLLLGQFSRLLVDRILSPQTIALLLLYKTPYFLVWALPVATLFSIFLALGRLGHDREIIALQAGGLSPRRLIVPLLIVGALISGVDFWLSDTLAPWGNRQFLSLYLQQFYGQRSTPQIRDNAFFKGADDRFFYVRRYDEERNLLEDVLVYDLTGQLAMQDGGEAFPKIITAETASWNGDTWELRSGVIHAFDDEGRLRYSDRFETLSIFVGETIRQMVFEQRTPSEMSMSELAERIAAFRVIGRPADSLVVEYHLKMALPLAGFVFALFGAPLSLLIGPRGRALGIILSVLLVLLYQGLLFWTATVLGNRGDLPPAWGAWLPNALFGLVGFVLFLRADRLGRLDLVERVRRFLPLSLVFVLLAGSAAAPAQAQEPEGAPPIEISADRLSVSQNWGELVAEGNVDARYQSGSFRAARLSLSADSDGERWTLEAQAARFQETELSGSAQRITASFLEQGSQFALERVTLTQSASVRFQGGGLTANALTLMREGERSWRVEAEGDVTLRREEQNQITDAERLELRLSLDPEAPDRWLLEDVTVEGFQGALDFVNARGQTHRLRYRGERATLDFDEENELKLIDVSNGDFTTCPCAENIPDAAYSFRAGRLILRPDELLAALNITLRAFGKPVFWAPAYIAPLGDIQQKYPFVPQIGQDARRGWFAKWRFPVFVDSQNYGFLLLDLYTGSREVGSGLDFSYRLLPGSQGGRFMYYRLVGEGESLSLDWSEHLALDERTRLDLSVGLRTGLLALEATRLLSQARLSGSQGDWSWQVGLSRDQNLLGPEPDPKKLKELRYRVLERLPELSLQKQAVPVPLWGLPVQYGLGLSWGRYREVPLEGPAHESARFDGNARISLPSLALASWVSLDAGVGARLSLYELDRREAWDLSGRVTVRPISAVQLSLEHLYRAVRGRSPFEFDRLAVSNRTNIQGRWQFLAGGSAQFRTGYDWQRERFDPATLSVSQSIGPARLSMQLQGDLNGVRMQKAQLKAVWNGAGWSLVLDGGYDFPRRRPTDLIARLDLGAPLRAAVRFDPAALSLKRVNVQSSWELSNWELSIGSEYDVGSGRFTAFQFGIIKKFCHACWQIGLYGTQEKLWVQASINAFPTAEVRYSPTDQSLDFGG